MLTLGIMDSHLSSAALIEDGRVVAAVREESFVGQKGYAQFPQEAIRWVLQGRALQDLEQIAFGLQSFPFDTHRFQAGHESLPRRMAGAFSPLLPGGFLRSRALAQGVTQLAAKRRRARAFRDLAELDLGPVDPHRIHFINHHLAHGAATGLFSPVKAQGPQLIFICDGFGDGHAGGVFALSHKGLERLQSTAFCDSLGSLYSRVTAHLGFKPWEHEYKVMGLAPYGESPEALVLKTEILSLYRFEGGRIVNRFRLSGQSLQRRLGRLLKGQRFDHIAFALQSALEALICRWIAYWVEQSQIRQIALGGGVFLNVKLNQHIHQLPGLDHVFIFPPAGDDGVSVGAALYAQAEARGWPWALGQIPALKGLFWGPSVEAELPAALDRARALGFTISQPENMAERAAQWLAGGRFLVRARGRGEFGPRALGHRSILGPAHDEALSRTLNSQVKKRDFWMPFAAVMTREGARDYLQGGDSPACQFMITTTALSPAGAVALAGTMHPADQTTRPQVLAPDDDPPLQEIIHLYGQKTGRYALLNTSLNLHGESMVMGALAAVDCFSRSGLRAMILGDYWIERPA